MTLDISPRWILAPGASAAWIDPADPLHRWFVYQRAGSWIARDRSLPADPREHGRDQERAFYSFEAMRDYITARYR